MDLKRTFIAFAFGLAATVHGQHYLDEVEVQLVQVDLTAVDSKGKFVQDLKPQELILKEDGKVQKVVHFSNSAEDNSVVPLTVCFLVDTSWSMNSKVGKVTRIELAQKAAIRVLEELKGSDRLLVMEFHNSAEEIVSLSSQKEDARKRIADLKAKGNATALLDVMSNTLVRLQEESGRKIFVLFTDGEDTASRTPQDIAIENVRKSDATIIAFGTNPLPSGRRAKSVAMKNVPKGCKLLEIFAETSGGYAFFPRKERDWEKAMEKLRSLIRSQYTLAYRPPQSYVERPWRKIDVECKRRGVKLKHRPGYWASQQAAAQYQSK